MLRWKTFLSAGLLIALTVLLVSHADTAKEGAREGVQLCESLLLPSLLPMMILSNTLLRSDTGELLSCVFGKVTATLFHLPRTATGAILLGLTCGYPTGAMLTASLYESGRLSRGEAHRLMRFNCSGGIAFTVTAVGSLTLHDVRSGIILLTINITASLLYALLDGIVRRREPLSAPKTHVAALSAADALPDAVVASLRGLSVMCAMIVLFSALLRLFPVPPTLLPLLEITQGVCRNELALPLPYTAFFLSFGGCCLHLQVYSYLKQTGMRYFDYLAGRTACALLSFALGQGYCRLFPDSSAVFCNLAAPQSRFSEGGVVFGLVMMAGCAVFIAEIRNRKLQSA